MHVETRIPMKTCPRCLGDRKQQPQNCGVCQDCHGLGEVPIDDETLGAIRYANAAVNVLSSRPLFDPPDLFVQHARRELQRQSFFGSMARTGALLSVA